MPTPARKLRKSWLISPIAARPSTIPLGRPERATTSATKGKSTTARYPHPEQRDGLGPRESSTVQSDAWCGGTYRAARQA